MFDKILIWHWLDLCVGGCLNQRIGVVEGFGCGIGDISWVVLAMLRHAVDFMDGVN